MNAIRFLGTPAVTRHRHFGFARSNIIIIIYENNRVSVTLLYVKLCAYMLLYKLVLSQYSKVFEFKHYIFNAAVELHTIPLILLSVLRHNIQYHNTDFFSTSIRRQCCITILLCV